MPPAVFPEVVFVGWLGDSVAKAAEVWKLWCHLLRGPMWAKVP